MLDGRGPIHHGHSCSTGAMTSINLALLRCPGLQPVSASATLFSGHTSLNHFTASRCDWAAAFRSAFHLPPLTWLTIESPLIVCSNWFSSSGYNSLPPVVVKTTTSSKDSLPKLCSENVKSTCVEVSSDGPSMSRVNVSEDALLPSNCFPVCGRNQHC